MRLSETLLAFSASKPSWVRGKEEEKKETEGGRVISFKNEQQHGRRRPPAPRRRSTDPIDGLLLGPLELLAGLLEFVKFVLDGRDLNVCWSGVGMRGTSQHDASLSRQVEGKGRPDGPFSLSCRLSALASRSKPSLPKFICACAERDGAAAGRVGGRWVDRVGGCWLDHGAEKRGERQREEDDAAEL